MSDRDIPYNSDQLPPFVGTKPGEIHCYFPKEEQRSPLLGQDQLETIAHGCCATSFDEAITAANKVRSFYEAKITGGELMVCKTAKLDKDTKGGLGFECSLCGHYWPRALYPSVGEFCFCGAKIIA